MTTENAASSLIDEYMDETMMQSICTVRTMSRAPAWQKIVELPKDESVPALLRALRDQRGGMAIMCLLRFITGENPMAAAQTPVAPGFVGTDVGKAMQLWCEWGQQNNYM